MPNPARAMSPCGHAQAAINEIREAPSRPDLSGCRECPLFLRYFRDADWDIRSSSQVDHPSCGVHQQQQTEHVLSEYPRSKQRPPSSLSERCREGGS